MGRTGGQPRSPRRASVTRKTRETDVTVTLALDGSGRYDVKAGHRFLEHMIESLARFASFDVTVRARGDQEHHIWEDVALTLGAALRKALGTGPVQRVGYALLPMDEALLAVSVDLVDRPFADVNLPDEMFVHFLRSFAMEGKFTLHNVILKGRNRHHILEACFKALGLALRQAVQPAKTLQSTKGLTTWSARAPRKAKRS